MWDPPGRHKYLALGPRGQGIRQGIITPELVAKLQPERA